MIDLSKYPDVWCSICEAVKPVLFDEMPVDALNDHAAADILCSECRLVIATFHARPANPVRPSLDELLSGMTPANIHPEI